MGILVSLLLAVCTLGGFRPGMRGLLTSDWVCAYGPNYILENTAFWE